MFRAPVLFAQEGVDSLLNLIQNEKVDSNRVVHLVRLGIRYGLDAEKGMETFKQAEELSRKIDFTKGIFASVQGQTEVMKQQGRYLEKLSLEQSMLEWTEQTGDSLLLATLLMNIAISYRMMNEYENAITYSERGRDIFARIGNTQFEGEINDIMQYLYAGLHQYRKAVKYGLQAIKKLEETGDASGLAYAYNNLGLTYIQLKEYDSARVCLMHSARNAELSDNLGIKISNELNYGYIHLLQGIYDSVRAPVEKALHLARNTQMHEFEGLALWGMANYYLGKKQYNRAQQYCDTVLQMANQYNYPDQKLKAYTTLSQIAFAMQDITQGNHYASQTEQIRDSILNESIARNTIQIEKKYETERKRSAYSITTNTVAPEKYYELCADWKFAGITGHFISIVSKLSHPTKIAGATYSRFGNRETTTGYSIAFKRTGR
ncbi:MAG: hypothetical protein NVV59_17880 [Chitinophagaceae bacterium]|nr:hypothetical protein [Chitinophagaceae bacterium]